MKLDRVSLRCHLPSCKGLLVALCNKWCRPCLQEGIRSWLLCQEQRAVPVCYSCDVHATHNVNMNLPSRSRFRLYFKHESLLRFCCHALNWGLLLGLQIVGSKNRLWCSPRVMYPTLSTSQFAAPSSSRTLDSRALIWRPLKCSLTSTLLLDCRC